MITSRPIELTRPQRIGIAADHGGFALKQHVLGMLRESRRRVIDQDGVRQATWVNQTDGA